MTVVSMSWFDAFAYCAFERANGMRFPPSTYAARVFSVTDKGPFVSEGSDPGSDPYRALTEVGGCLVEEHAGDDELLDLLGPLEDVEDLRVPCPLFQELRLVVPNRAAQLDTTQRDVGAR